MIISGMIPYCIDCEKLIIESGCIPVQVLKTGFTIIHNSRHNVSYCKPIVGQEAEIYVEFKSY